MYKSTLVQLSTALESKKISSEELIRLYIERCNKHNNSLNCFITDCGEKCQARLEVDAELNMMMKMMVEKPITNFLNVLSDKLRTL